MCRHAGKWAFSNMLCVAVNGGKKLFSVVGMSCTGLNRSKRTPASGKLVIHMKVKNTESKRIDTSRMEGTREGNKSRLKRTLKHSCITDTWGRMDYVSRSLSRVGPARSSWS